MRLLHKILAVLVSTTLVACASNPVPPLGDSAYPTIAGQWYVVNRCAELNLMNLDTAALGRRYVEGHLRPYQVDHLRLSKEIEYINQSGVLPTPAQCNQMAMSILDQRQQIEAHNENVQSTQQAFQTYSSNKQVKSTVCNQLGSQLYCMSQ